MDRRQKNSGSEDLHQNSQQLTRVMLARISRIVLLHPCPPLLRIPAITSIRHYANIDKKNPTRKKAFKMLDDELKTLHVWISRLSVDSMPKDLCKVSFSRSSGPGGQNVNK